MSVGRINPLMNIKLSSAGAYPRVGDGPGQQRHRAAYAQLEKSEISPEQFEKVQEEVTAEILVEQADAGLDILTDGLVRWYDPISHLVGKMQGAKINGLLRYFDTNFYVRQPVIESNILRTKPLIVEEFNKAKKAAPKPVKPVLTGPYTLAKLSIVKTPSYKKLGALVEDIADALADEVADLAAAGAKVIQIDEPVLLHNKRDMAPAAAAFKKIAAKKGAAKIMLHSFFGDVAPFYDALQKWPVDILGLDFTYSPKLAAKIASSGSRAALALGLFDGRNTKLETEKDVLPVMDKIAKKVKVDIEWCPSCGLDYLPRQRACEKIVRMNELRSKWQG